MSKRYFFTLPQLIEFGAETRPDQEAFVCGAATLSYEELWEKVCCLATQLHLLGTQKGDRIGVYMNRSLESVIAVYGIMQAGAVFVPIDPVAPPSRVQFVLNDCQISILICNPGQRRFLGPAIEGESPLQHIIGIDGDWKVPHTTWEEVYQLRSKTQTTPYILEQDLAYIMYTSGSTGTPKGIMHSHYSGLSYARLSAELYGIQSQDRVGGHSQLHFDMSTFGYFTSPLAGATTIVIPDAHTKMPVSLAQLMEKEQISVWYSVPLALTQLLQRGGIEERDLSHLRWVLFGGEPFPPKLLRRLMEIWPQARFSNVYGPAEVNQCTYYNIPALPDPEKPVPLGYVWDNTEALILNEDKQEALVGEVGELLIRSATRMKGYWNQAQLTQEKFYIRETVPGNPEVFYRTGDLAKWGGDQLLYFMGRKDRQIKVRGYRVELNEIEGVLMRHDAVAEAAAFSFPIENHERGIAAHVILKSGKSLSQDELMAYAQVNLPAYAIPSDIILTNSFPRTDAGKINYKALEQNQ